MKLVGRVAAIIALVALATAAKSATSNDFARNPYLSYSCADLVKAATKTSAHAEQTAGISDYKNTKNDPTKDAIVFWPKAFLTKVSGPKGKSLSQLKDQMIAIEQAAVEAQCQIQFDGTRPPGA